MKHLNVYARLNKIVASEEDDTVVGVRLDDFEGYVEFDGNKWRERTLEGKQDAPDGWGNKTYQSYLTAKDVKEYLIKDYPEAEVFLATLDEEDGLIRKSPRGRR